MGRVFLGGEDLSLWHALRSFLRVTTMWRSVPQKREYQLDVKSASSYTPSHQHNTISVSSYHKITPPSMSGRGRNGERTGRGVPAGRNERPRRQDVLPPSRFRQTTFRAPARGNIGRLSSDGGRVSNIGGRASNIGGRETNGGARASNIGSRTSNIGGRAPSIGGGGRQNGGGRTSIGGRGSNSTETVNSLTVATSLMDINANVNDKDTNNKSNSTKKKNGTKSDDPPTPWRTSTAKKKLFDLFMDESSWVQICTCAQIYDADPDFRKYKKHRFVTNAENLKNRIEKCKAAVEFDREALTHDQQLYPKQTMTERGYMRYEGSEVERLLKADVKEGRSKGVRPKVLWLSRPEYIEMPLDVFRSHKNREDQYLVESVGWQKKRNDKARKKHEMEAEKLKEGDDDDDDDVVSV